MLEHRGRLGAGWWRSARFGLSSLRGRGRGARDPGAGSREAEQRAPPRFAVFSGGNAKNSGRNLNKFKKKFNLFLEGDLKPEQTFQIFLFISFCIHNIYPTINYTLCHANWMKGAKGQRSQHFVDCLGIWASVELVN